MLQVTPKNLVEAKPAAKVRVASIDALRGFNFIWILGAEGVFLGLEQMLANKGPALAAVGHALGLQMTHAEWEGFRFYDLVFPLFVFITGVAIVFSLGSLVVRNGLAGAHLRIVRRALLLYLFGVILAGGIGGHWSDVRLVGVLQRIAICYLVVSLLFINLSPRGLAAAFVASLAGYWALMAFVPVPGLGAASFAPDANLANWIDAHYLPGKLWDKTRDPEGLLSTIPAIGTCLLGVLAGLVLKDGRIQPTQKSLTLIVAGVVCLALGYLWSLQFPIIKYLWTSSFVLVAGGYSLLLLGTWYQIIDVWGYRGWSTAFIWIGTNAITLYVVNNLSSLERLAVRFVGGDFGRWLDSLMGEGTGKVLAHGLGLAFAVALAAFLYRRKIFLRV